MYLYAFPVQQFLATAWHVNRQGYVVYLALSILGTFPFAAASWWLVERRALALKRVTWSVVRRRVSSPVSRTRSGDDAHDVGSAPVGSGHA
jgi:peptidoglycan/LPS O-acetylase OafA/YrhL